MVEQAQQNEVRGDRWEGMGVYPAMGFLSVVNPQC